MPATVLVDSCNSSNSRRPADPVSLITPITQSEILKITTDLYPNPSVGKEATIRYSIPEAGKVTICVFKTNSQLISEPLKEQFYKAGTYERLISTAGLEPGEYMYSVKTERYAGANRFIIENEYNHR
ncbi:MAG: hypothetical protein QM669_11175 [Siphonobacter sp.]